VSSNSKNHKYKDANGNGCLKLKAFFSSSGYQDELAWAAVWLYKATGETILEQCQNHLQSEWFLWNPKQSRLGLKVCWRQGMKQFQTIKWSDANIYWKILKKV